MNQFRSHLSNTLHVRVDEALAIVRDLCEPSRIQAVNGEPSTLVGAPLFFVNISLVSPPPAILPCVLCYVLSGHLQEQ